MYSYAKMYSYKGHKWNDDVDVNEGQRKQESAPSTLRSPFCETHPVQEVFLPSRWAATEMKISHLNFFAFVPPFGYQNGGAGGAESGIPDNSDTTLCHPALISDDGTLSSSPLALSIKVVIQPSSRRASLLRACFLHSSCIHIILCERIALH